MRIDFAGRTVLVTGASRGIGKQVARDMCACGADMIVTSTRESEADKLVDELGSGVKHFAVDFSDAGSTERFLEDLRSLGKLDVCINNAGIARHGPISRATSEDWDQTNDVNLKAPFFVAQAAAELMKSGGYGRIVNVGSIWSHITKADRSVYTATKFGLRGLTMSFALELAGDGILVNMVAPGATMTDMVRENYSEQQLQSMADEIPLGRLGTTGDVSSAILFLASDLNTYVTGQSLVVDGGYSVAR